MSSRILFLLFFLVSTKVFFSQTQSPEEKREYKATRIQDSPEIDGRANEKVWENVPETSNFVMFEPGDGNPSRPTHPTRVKLAYNDEAVFIAASMLDNEPERIRRVFAQRDNLPVADYFMVDLNTYNDGENQTRFIVTAAGTLADAKMKGNREDYAYDVVWDAKVLVDSLGWHVEIKIPYSALRFPEKEEQVWGVQFGRSINHLNEKYVWNYIDKSVGKSTHYNGILKGISNIQPPIRLSFYPYISGEVNHFRSETEAAMNAGMDFKYGINDAFTLDATLIPDFGQTAYDEVELNLGPFEQTFGENRAFFTEGTELFTKGDLFYSRRIGGVPLRYNSAENKKRDNEEIVENPEKTGLLNAVKISGRTDGGLGIGFFNAITQKEKITYRNKTTGETREELSEPFANYNIFVLDQQLDQKSSVSIINTNVTREGHFRDGNVSGFLFDVYNNSSSFNFEGEAKMSRVNYHETNKTGFASSFSIARTKGQIRYAVSHKFANETYDINDLGLNFYNNYNNFFFSTSYQIFEPQGIFNDYSIRLYGNHKRRYSPDIATGSAVGLRFFGATKSRFAFGGALEHGTAYKDFFEPRKEGYFVQYDPYISIGPWISSDYRKTFSYDIGLWYRKDLEFARQIMNLEISPRLRLSNKLSFIYSFEYSKDDSRKSFVEILPHNIIFGNRTMESVENSFRGSYNFNTEQAINLSFRNFWSVAAFDSNEFSRLKEDGTLQPSTYVVDADNNPDANFNIWNLDLSYQWRFAPGSEMILLYRNSLFKLDEQSDLDYTHSLETLFREPLRQNLSLRIVYYLDYSTIKNVIKG